MSAESNPGEPPSDERQLAPPRPLIVATAVWFILTWIVFVNPSGYDTLFGLWLIGWLALIILWLGLALLLFRVRSSPWRPWLCLPIFLGLTIVVLWAQAPFWLGYLTSRPAMDRAAHAVIDGKRDPSKIRWIGVYPIGWGAITSRGVVFTVRGSASSTQGALAFLYRDTPRYRRGLAHWPACAYGNLHHMTGRWFTFRLRSCLATSAEMSIRA